MCLPSYSNLALNACRQRKRKRKGKREAEEKKEKEKEKEKVFTTACFVQQGFRTFFSECPPLE